MGAYALLNMDQGATFNNTINLTDDITSANINVSGYSVQSQMRKSYESANATANIVCTITDSANGVITMSLAAANTANIRKGRYVFDVVTTTPGGVVNRILEGIIDVSPRVSR